MKLVHLTSRPTRLRRSLLMAVPRLTGEARKADVVVGSEIGVELIAGFVAARIARKPFVVGVHADLVQALGEWVPGGRNRN